eukprot:TRINITY_DN11547_c1_g1_i1.p1 TRINITY_DN11547_c1_g1~~TRINITY_DN11547_c1_g1_i1.p1  ORF type:complete len:1954 (+),score=382.31 TRINITY_DN11547_c1_g1_i1:113-5974(+)
MSDAPEDAQHQLPMSDSFKMKGKPALPSLVGMRTQPSFSSAEEFLAADLSSPKPMNAGSTSSVDDTIERNDTGLTNNKSRRRRNQLESLTPEDIQTFLPITLCQHLADNPSLDYQLRSESGLILYVDVAGFTTIMEKFNKVEQGAERMGHELNQTFTLILDVVNRYGGDVVQFSGDAVMAVWKLPEVNEESTPKRVRKQIKNITGLAAKCAMETLTASRTIKIGQEEVDFELHVGLAAGPIDLAIIGSRSRWKFLLLGETVAEAGLAANIAKGGNVVTTTHTVSISKGLISSTSIEPDKEEDTSDPPSEPTYHLITKVGKIPKGAASLRPSLERPPTVSKLQLFVPQLVLHLLVDMARHAESSSRARNGHAPLTAGEMRIVSSIFLKINFSRSPIKADELNSTYLSIEKALHKTGGVCNKLIFDDKGLVCLCVYGLPGFSEEDDAMRSISFAKSIYDKLSSKGIQISVGITRSRAYCGICGSNWRREYTVLGDGVNLAARLMSEAHRMQDPGEGYRILADDLTRESCLSTHEFSDCARITVKGKEISVRVFQLTAAIPGSSRSGSGSVASVVRASPSLRRADSTISRQSSLHTSLSRSSSELLMPQSPVSVCSGRSRASSGQGITVVTPLAKALRAVTRVSLDEDRRVSDSDNSGDESIQSTHIFPCTTVHGQILVLGRNEEMKAISQTIERLVDLQSKLPANRRRRKRPAMQETGEDGQQLAHRVNSQRSMRSMRSIPATPKQEQKNVTSNAPIADAEVDKSLKTDDLSPSTNPRPPSPIDIEPQPGIPPIDSFFSKSSAGKTVQQSPLMPKSETFEAMHASSHDSEEDLDVERSESVRNAPPPPPPPVPMGKISSPGTQSLPMALARRRTNTLTSIDLASQPRPKCILIQGEAGIGKSHLLHKALEQARDKGITGHFIAGSPIGRSRPFGALSNLIQRLIDKRGMDQVIDGVRPLGTYQKSLLKRICPEIHFEDDTVDCPDDDPMPIPEGEDHDIETTISVVNETIKTLLRNHNKGQPYMLAFDDVHWIDDLTWSLINYIFDEPLACIILTRRIRGHNESADADGILSSPTCSEGFSSRRASSVDEDVGPVFKDAVSFSTSSSKERLFFSTDFNEAAKGTAYKLRTLSNFMTTTQAQAQPTSMPQTPCSNGSNHTPTHMQPLFMLSALDKDSCMTFYRMLLGVRNVEKSVFEFAYNRSRGNPGIAERLFVALKDEKALLVLSGTQVVEFSPTSQSKDFEMMVPHDIEAMVVSLVDKLPYDSQTHLKMMAVIGMTFTRELIASLTELSDSKLSELLDLLVSLNILSYNVVSQCYAFQMSLLRDCLYQRILVHQRRMYHGQVAKVMEGTATATDAVLADHLMKSGDERAIVYLDSALRDEVDRKNWNNASNLVQQIINCSTDEIKNAKQSAPNPHHIQWNRVLAVSHLHCGSHNAAIHALSSYRDSIREPSAALLLQQFESPFYCFRQTMSSLYEWFVSPCKSAATSEEILLLRERMLFYSWWLQIELNAQGSAHLVEVGCINGLKWCNRLSEATNAGDDNKSPDEGTSEDPLNSPGRPSEVWVQIQTEVPAGHCKQEIRIHESNFNYMLAYLQFCKGNKSKGTQIFQDTLKKSKGGKNNRSSIYSSLYSGNSVSTSYMVCLAMRPELASLMTNTEQIDRGGQSALIQIQELVSIASSNQDTYFHHFGLATQIVMEVNRGRLKEALSACGQLREATSGRNGKWKDVRFHLYSLTLACMILHQLDSQTLSDPRERIETVLHCYELDKSIVSDPILLLLLSTAVGLGLCRERQVHRAAKILEYPVNVHDEIEKLEVISPFHLLIIPSVLEVLISKARLDPEAADSDHINTLIDKYDHITTLFPVARSRYYYWLGIIHRDQDQTDEALCALESSINCAESCENEFEVALAKYETATLPEASNELRTRYLREAKEIFTKAVGPIGSAEFEELSTQNG